MSKELKNNIEERIQRKISKLIDLHHASPEIAVYPAKSEFPYIDGLKISKIHFNKRKKQDFITDESNYSINYYYDGVTGSLSNIEIECDGYLVFDDINLSIISSELIIKSLIATDEIYKDTLTIVCEDGYTYITPKNITVDTSMYYRFIHEADDEIISFLDGIIIKHLQAMDSFLHTYIKLVKEKRRENDENSKSNIAKQMREMFSEYINTQNIDMKTGLLNVKEQLRKRNEPNVKNFVNVSILKNLKRLIEDDVLTTQYNFTSPTERDDEICFNKEETENKEENKMIVSKNRYNATNDEKQIEKIGKEIETNLEKIKELGFAEKVIFSNVSLQQPLHEVLKLQEKSNSKENKFVNTIPCSNEYELSRLKSDRCLLKVKPKGSITFIGINLYKLEKILTIVKKINDPAVRLGSDVRLTVDYTSFKCCIMPAPYSKTLSEKETLDILFGSDKEVNKSIQTAMSDINDLLLVTERLLEALASEEEYFEKLQEGLKKVNEILMKKYELTEETITISGHILHRIRALKDFSDVKEGDLGGWVESEENLSQEGNCWIYDDAKIFDNAVVCGNGVVKHKSECFGRTYITDNAKLCGHVTTTSHTVIAGNAKLSGFITTEGDIKIFDNVKVIGNVNLTGEITLCSNALLVAEEVTLYLHNSGFIGDNAYITNSEDLNTISMVDNKHCPKSIYLAFYKTKDKGIYAGINRYKFISLSEFEKGLQNDIQKTIICFIKEYFGIKE